MALIPPKWEPPREIRNLKLMPAQAVLYQNATKISSKYIDGPMNLDMITGIGFGKSLSGALAYRDICLSRPDDSSCIYGPSYPTLQRSTLYTLGQIIDRQKDIVSWNKSDNVIEWANGHVSHIFPMDQEAKIDRARGPTYSAAWGDERSLCPKLAYDVISGRLRAQNYPLSHYGTGTPKGFDWIYYLHKVDHREDPDYYLISSEKFNVSTFHNPTTPKKYKVMVWKQYGNTRFAKQELWGEFTASSGLVWDFTIMGQVRALPKNIRFDITFGIIDFGFSDPCAIEISGLQKTAKDFDLWTFDEYYESRKMPDEIAAQVKKMHNTHHVSTWLADSARPDLISHIHAKTGINIIPTKKEEIPNGIARVASLLSQDRWHFTSRCSAAIDEHMKYHYPMKDNKPCGEIPVDKDNHTCLAAGTLVETDKGSVPIERVKAGMMVLSADGLYHKVIGQWLTNPYATVYKLRFSNGSDLVATGNHPIWVEQKGWTRADDMRYSDIVRTLTHIAWYQVRKSYLMGLNTSDTPTQRGGTTESITSLKGLAKSLLDTFIGLSMRSTTAQSPGDLTYITQTETPSTTISQILSSLRVKGTSLCMVKRGSQILSRMRKIRSSWQGLDPRPQSGTAPRKALSGILRIAAKCGAIESHISTSARTAAKNLNTLPSKHRRGFAPTTVNQHGGERVGLTTPKGNAPFAEENSQSISIARHKPVQTHAGFSSIEKIEQRMPVYNLEVEGSHNYFANGILVHNCDCSRYLVDYLSQIGYLGDVPVVTKLTFPGARKRPAWK